MSELDELVRRLLVEALTCPNCDIFTADGWCMICGSEYPAWERPRLDPPVAPTPNREQRRRLRKHRR